MANTRKPSAAARYGAVSIVSRRLASRTRSTGYDGVGQAGSTVALGAAKPLLLTRSFAARTEASTADTGANVDWPPRYVAIATTAGAPEMIGLPASLRTTATPGRTRPSSAARATPRFADGDVNAEPNATRESPPLYDVSDPSGSSR